MINTCCRWDFISSSSSSSSSMMRCCQYTAQKESPPWGPTTRGKRSYSSYHGVVSTLFATVPRNSDRTSCRSMFRRSPKKSPARDYEVLNQKYIQQTNDYEQLRVELSSLKSKYAAATSELEDVKEQSKREMKLAEKRESDMRKKYKDEFEAMQVTALRRESEMKRLAEDVKRSQEATSKYTLSTTTFPIFLTSKCWESSSLTRHYIHF